MGGSLAVSFFLPRWVLWFIIKLKFFWREFQPMTSAPNDSILSLDDQDTNKFSV